jgi:GT2 family glycosyltransferase
MLRIDLAVTLDGALLVAGWRTGGLHLSLRARGGSGASAGADEEAGDASSGFNDHDGSHVAVAPPRNDRPLADVRRFDVPRPDVAEHLGLPPESAETMGFALLLDPMPAGRLELCWRHPVEGRMDRHRLRIARPVFEADGPACRLRGMPRLAPAGGRALSLLAARWPAFSPRWRAFVARCPNAPPQGALVAGHLEAAWTDETGGAIATGWLAAPAHVPVWLQDEDGRLHPVSGAPRHFRDDAFRRMGQLGIEAPAETGFAIALPALKAASRLRLRALTPSGVAGLGWTPCEPLPAHPLEATRRLVEMDPTSPLSAERIGVDGAVLSAIVARHAAGFDARPVESIVVGTPPASPLATIVVPLYARRDLAEHQLLGFSQDPAFLRRCELVYVIDDPRLLDDWQGHARTLSQSWGVPMRWVWGGVQRGFAGASNLGARFARGRHIVFLNSDVFPIETGWVERLCAPLDADPSIGAVGPRLLHVHGAIQHAGMAFRWRGDLGLWVNHHPSRGLSPAHDPHERATEVDAVTGACLAMRREVFERVGGWDSGYLVGDFEDSDLCLRLRERGLRSVYLPEVELTHLERQSMRDLGEARLRRYVTMNNALRHQARWGARLDAMKSQRTVRLVDPAPRERAA